MPITLRHVLQKLLIAFGRPYIVRELPGWGMLFRYVIGDYQREAFWKGASEREIVGKMHGYRMRLQISQWSDRNTFFLGRWHELETQLLMKDVLMKGDTVADIGANRGMFTLYAAYLVGPTGKVLSFEPNPEVRSRLERELTVNDIRNVIVFGAGLSDERGTLTLTIPDHNSGEATFGAKFNSGLIAAKQIEVPVLVGDDALASQNPSLIKIDVEGFETRVIKGLRKTLAASKPVVITEVVSGHLKACDSSPEALFALFKELGYEGFHLKLSKKADGYEWAISKPQPSDDSYNAVWLHANCQENLRCMFDDHLSG
jgi:FkbM family methyltransferase